MGMRSFCISVSTLDQIHRIRVWSEVFGHYYWKIVQAHQGIKDEDVKTKLLVLHSLLSKGIVDKPTILNFDGDTQLSVCGFKYFCGKIWMLVSTGLPGEIIVKCLQDIGLFDLYTRISFVTAEFHQTTTVSIGKVHLDYKSRWKQAGKLFQEMSTSRSLLKTDEYLKAGFNVTSFVDFEDFFDKQKNIYFEWLVYSDPPICPDGFSRVL